MAEQEPCGCEHGGYYDPDEYTSCYQCFLDRRADYLQCIYCDRWHSPLFNTCFKCRALAPERDEAGARLRLDILLRDDFRCRYCGGREGGMQVDHVKPCVEGGTADPWNLQVLCADCNRTKGRTWWRGGAHDKARVRLMHIYFTFLWQWLDEGQQADLRLHAKSYGDEFARHARYEPRVHALCADCDKDASVDVSPAVCPGPTHTHERVGR